MLGILLFATPLRLCAEFLKKQKFPPQRYNKKRFLCNNSFFIKKIPIFAVTIRYHFLPLFNTKILKTFEIIAVSHPQQIIDMEDVTEWTFFVKPLVTGAHLLLLRVSIVEKIDNENVSKTSY